MKTSRSGGTVNTGITSGTVDNPQFLMQQVSDILYSQLPSVRKNWEILGTANRVLQSNKKRLDDQERRAKEQQALQRKATPCRNRTRCHSIDIATSGRWQQVDVTDGVYMTIQKRPTLLPSARKRGGSNMSNTGLSETQSRSYSTASQNESDGSPTSSRKPSIHPPPTQPPQRLRKGSNNRSLSNPEATSPSALGGARSPVKSLSIGGGGEEGAGSSTAYPTAAKAYNLSINTSMDSGSAQSSQRTPKTPQLPAIILPTSSSVAMSGVGGEVEAVMQRVDSSAELDSSLVASKLTLQNSHRRHPSIGASSKGGLTPAHKPRVPISPAAGHLSARQGRTGGVSPRSPLGGRNNTFGYLESLVSMDTLSPSTSMKLQPKQATAVLTSRGISAVASDTAGGGARQGGFGSTISRSRGGSGVHPSTRELSHLTSNKKSKAEGQLVRVLTMLDSLGVLENGFLTTEQFQEYCFLSHLQPNAVHLDIKGRAPILDVVRTYFPRASVREVQEAIDVLVPVIQANWRRKLSEKARAEMAAVFQRFDTQGRGYLTFHDLYTEICKGMCKDVITQQDLMSQFQQAGVDMEYVSLYEFEELMKDILLAGDPALATKSLTTVAATSGSSSVPLSPTAAASAAVANSSSSSSSGGPTSSNSRINTTLQAAQASGSNSGPGTLWSRLFPYSGDSGKFWGAQREFIESVPLQ